MVGGDAGGRGVSPRNTLRAGASRGAARVLGRSEPQSLKAPPYAARWRELLARGRPLWGNGSAWLIAGPQAWEISGQWKDTNRLFLACPPDSSPDAFDWRQLAAAPPPIIVHAPGLPWGEVERLAGYVLAAGTARLLVRSGDQLVSLRGAA